MPLFGKLLRCEGALVAFCDNLTLSVHGCEHVDVHIDLGCDICGVLDGTSFVPKRRK